MGLWRGYDLSDIVSALSSRTGEKINCRTENAPSIESINDYFSNKYGDKKNSNLTLICV